MRKTHAASGVDLEFLDVVIFEIAEVVPRRIGGQVGQERVRGTSGWIGLAGKHFTEGLESGLSRMRHPKHGLDLRIVLREVQLEGVGPVVYQHNLLEVLRNQVDHVFLGLTEFQIMRTLWKVLVILGIVVVGYAIGLHIGRQVEPFASHTSDNYHCGVGEVLRIADEFVGIGASRRFGEGPVG